MQKDADAANVRVPPPLTYLGLVVTGVLLHHFVLSLPLLVPMSLRIGVAAMTAITAIVLLGAAMKAFIRTGQNPKPWKTTPEFIATGAYRRTRNPMYAGFALIQVGLAFGLANAWILALLPVSIAVIYATAIRPEEIYLEEKFGESYREYKSSVRRWI